MESVILILFLTFGGSVAYVEFTTCEVNKCDRLLPPQMDELFRGHLPNGEELKNLCPSVLETLDCASNSIVKCTGQNLEELVQSDNETVVLLARFILNTKNVIIDLCDENTEMHKNYVSHVACFMDMIKNPSDTCRNTADKLYSDYRSSLNVIDEDENSERTRREGDCMGNAYIIVCFATRLQEKCGDAAKETFLEIFAKRFQFLKLGFCNEDDFLTLKTKFLDFLEAEGESREAFTSAFDFKRK